MTACPDENDLAEWLGSAAAAPNLRWEEHVEGCEACRLASLAYAESLPASTAGAPAGFATHEGRFELLQMVGRGGFSMVWQARDLANQRTVALKIVDDELDGDAAKRALREARALLAMDSPHLRKVFEVFRTVDNRIAIVGEFLDGHDLAVELRSRGACDEARAKDIVRAIAHGLAYAHGQGIVHRDLKPSNVFVDRAGGPIRILDFGLAKWMDALGITSKLTATGTVLGTPSYMSPEQIAGEASLGPPTDLWSLGVLAIELMTGKVPVEGRSFGAIFRVVTTGNFPRLREAVPGVSGEFAALVDSLLQLDADRRPSAAAVVAALG